MLDAILSVVFDRLLVDVLPLANVETVVSAYVSQGVRALFKYALALLSVHKKKLKTLPKSALQTGKDWFEELRSLCSGVDFTKVEGVAGGYSWGKNLNKRVGFPSDKKLQRKYGRNGVRAGEEVARIEAAERAERATTKGDGGDDDAVVVEEVVVNYRPLQIKDPPPSSTTLLASSPHTRQHLANWVPQNLKGRLLSLLYHTELHGRSLETLYMKLKETGIVQTVTFVEVLGGEGRVVGMFASDLWEKKTTVYGNGSCFVFVVNGEEGKVHNWSPRMGGGSNDEDEEEDEVSLR